MSTMPEVMEQVRKIYGLPPGGQVPYTANVMRKYIHKAFRALRDYERLEGHPVTEFAVIEAPAWVLEWPGALPEPNKAPVVYSTAGNVILHSGRTGIYAVFNPQIPPLSVKAVTIRDQTKEGLHRLTGRKRIME